MANLFTLTTLLFMAGCASSFFASTKSENLQYPKKSFLETILTRPIFAEGENDDLADLKYPSESLISSLINRVLSTFSRIRVSVVEKKGGNKIDFRVDTVKVENRIFCVIKNEVSSSKLTDKVKECGKQMKEF